MIYYMDIFLNLCYKFIIMFKKIKFTFYICICVFISYKSLACGLGSCDQISDYRSEKASLDENASQQVCEDHSWPELKSVSEIIQSMNPNFGNNKFNQFYNCLNEVSNEVQQRRDSDIKNVREEIRRLGVDELSKDKQMELLEGLLGEDSFFSYFQAERNKGAGQRPATLFTYTGPAVEMASALNGAIEQRGVFKQIYKQSGFDILRQQENPINFLIEQALSTNRHLASSPQSQNFTPGMSKLILFEMIRSVHHNNSLNSENYMAEFNEFAKKIKLGIVIPESDFISSNNEELERNKARFQYTINDGYFFSSNLSHFDPRPPSAPMSFDCTSFIQFCSFGRNSFTQDPELKIVTTDFIAAYTMQNDPELQSRLNGREQLSIQYIQDTFHIEPLKCETQLYKGDMVVFKGHIFIFDGYETNGNQIQMKTIEASGNHHRTLGSFTRDIYTRPQCSNFIWGRDDALPGGKNRDAFIVRFKTPQSKTQQGV